jgi:Uma2 family endonuclease
MNPTTVEKSMPVARQLLSGETGQRVILPGVSWETYRQLLADFEDNHAAHFTYDRGVLEIMVLSLKHEKLKHLLATLVELLAAEWGLDIEGAGSTTFRRQDLARGFEPDACFYLKNVEYIRQKDEIDLAEDPPPDLVIEIDITSPSLNKLPIYAAMGVAEVWRYDSQGLTIFKLAAGAYQVQPESAALPGLTSQALSDLIQAGQSLKRAAWLRQVRRWARKLVEPSG